MDSNIGASLDLMFGHEGAYSNTKTDSGNFFKGVLVGTKYGITGATLAAHRGVNTITAKDVKSMTREEAEAIYRKSYWGQSGGSLLPIGIDYMAFDFGVNSGPSRSVKSLQGVVGVDQDGTVGVKTLNAVKSYPGGLEKLARDYADARMKFLRGLGGPQGFKANGRGWTIRVTGKDPKGQYAPKPGVVGNAIAMIRGNKSDLVPPSEGSAKGDVKNTSITEIAKKVEVFGPAAGALSGLGSVLVGNGPIQWALAAGIVVGIGFGIYAFVNRVRSNG